MTKKEIDKIFRLRGTWQTASKNHNDTGIICRCIYEHLREYYFMNGIDDNYIGIVSTIEYAIPPSRLSAFISLGIDNDIGKTSVVGKFVHSVLVKHMAIQPDIYDCLDDGEDNQDDESIRTD